MKSVLARGRRRFAFTAIIRLTIAIAAATVASTAIAWAGDPPPNPAVVTDLSRDPALANDFLRLTYLPAGIVPDHLGGPKAVRVFVTASSFFKPPLTLQETASYPGLVDSQSQVLVAFRCKNNDLSQFDALLASWPNVFTAIKEDYGGQFTCPPPPSSPPENEVYCLVKDYVDTPNTSASVAIEAAMSLGASMFDPDFPERASMLQSRYGIYPAFTGIGFSVKGSGDGGAELAAEFLRNAIVPEYLVINLPIADTTCRCIMVPPYDGRSQAPLDPDFIWRRGGVGQCVEVPRLRRASANSN
ncbi:MAG TPA: hypothetical protein VEC38_09975 [Candidatus Binataceae bacterium]|nr:hypothetical protein [Candidatus Binataceae bacterium]